MSQAYDDDLRVRVLEACASGPSARAAAAWFDVWIATAIQWLRRERETVQRTARRQGKPRGSRLDAHDVLILKLMQAPRDVTLLEMAARLRDRDRAQHAHLAASSARLNV